MSIVVIGYNVGGHMNVSTWWIFIIYLNILQIYSGITRGGMLNGELLYT